ncbi:MBL fold metallo-hydrolase [Granulicella mallensis]|uniref:Beta-lactamase domain protein n=1 Tax=Granulicella mallensis (strain ATCC BAA-1857 / DSM 23137 / MP5ACTX8) TaxID=682795 RepID=G8NQG4_GRAMM|nr:MBL fold metallo-hydrolase [Granulicella mallensis]AEU36113.1 beta-lactamase domain protein [Granulicella mallensis MP5ACTX8]
MLFEQVANSSIHALFNAEEMRATGDKANIVSHTLRSGITVLSGSGGNIAVLNGPDGKVMVDSGFATSQPEIETALSLISDEPVRSLVNTHWHFDHTDGNQWVYESGAVIIGHRNNRVRMQQEQAIPAFEVLLHPSSKSELPTIVFDNDLTLELNDERILLRGYAPAHTDSDISVYFERADVLHVGDTWLNGIYPFIDCDSGGNIDGVIAASLANLELAGPNTIVIPGHGAIGNRNDLLEFHEMLVGIQSRVAALKANGATLEAVIAARPTEPFDDKWGRSFIPPELFTENVYEGV